MRARGRRGADLVGERRGERHRVGRERRVRVGEDRAPGAVGNGRQPVRDLAVDPAYGAHAPAHGRRPGRGLVEGVVLARVGDGRVGREDLAGVDEPDVVARGAFHLAPAQEARVRRPDDPRDVRPAHVEGEEVAPGGRAVARDRAHVRVERVRDAREPRQRDLDRDGRRAQDLLLARGRRAGRDRRAGPAGLGDGGRSGDCRGAARGRARSCGRGRGRGGRDVHVVADIRPDERVLAEAPARRQLELVAGRAAYRRPCERRRAWEDARDRLVRAQQEAAQVLRRGGRGRARERGGGRDRHERERCEEEGGTTGDGHRPTRCRQGRRPCFPSIEGCPPLRSGREAAP